MEENQEISLPQAGRCPEGQIARLPEKNPKVLQFQKRWGILILKAE
jgi:hypothetical protein